MFDTQNIIRPKLNHIGVTTNKIDKMVDWYRQVLGMTIVQRSGTPTGTQEGPSLFAAWLSNDEANHRIAIMGLPGLTTGPDRSGHKHLQHVAFEYESLDNLLGSYVRLKALGINPVLTIDHGATTAFYYEDPDRNRVELAVDNYGDARKSTQYMKSSPDFAANPMGICVDPDKIVSARRAGVTPWEIHERVWDGEFGQPNLSNPKSSSEFFRKNRS